MAPDLMAANKLPGLMRELGYSCTASESSFLKLLSQVPRIDEVVAAEVLAVMITSLSGLEDNLGLHATLSAALDGSYLGDPGSTTWNFNTVVDAFKRSNPQLDWSKVADLLDTPTFLVHDQQAFVLLTAAYKRATGSQLPAKPFISRLWSNTMGQASFLKFAVNAPPETFSFAQSDHRIEPLENLHGGKNPLGTPNQAWASIDLLSLLCKLEQGPAQQLVRQMVDIPLKVCPEVLLVAMAAVQPEGQQWPALQREVLAMLMPVYLANNPNSIPVMQRLWMTNRSLVIRSMVDWYQQDTTHISRILDVCQDIKALSTILDSTPFPFSIEMAALAHRREYLNLEKWLSERLVQGQMGFLQAMIDFVDQKTQVVDGQPVAQLPGRVSVSMESLAIFLRAFVACRSSSPPLAPGIVSELNRVQAQAINAFPQLQVLVQGPATPVFAPDVEEEVNITFQKLYTDQISLEEVIAKLRHGKASSNPRDQEVFACMIHNLFDEYKFFNKYPSKELRQTAILFGQLVHLQLVSSISLGIALRNILETLAKPLSDPLFKFGIEALSQFRSQIGTWPAFVAQLLQIPHMREADPELYAAMEKMMSGQQGAAAAAAARGALPGLPGGLPQDAPLPAAVQTLPAAAAAQQQVKPLGQQGMFGLAGGPDALVEGAGGMGNGVGEALQAGEGFGMPSVGGLRPGFSAQGFGSNVTVDASSSNEPADLSAAAAALARPNEQRVGRAAAQPNPTPPEQDTQPQPGQYTSMEGGDAGSIAAQVANSVTQPSLPSNVETLEAAGIKYSAMLKIKEPGEKVSDRIFFIVNNITFDNIESKVKDLRPLICPDYLAWFANYLVQKRAPQEANHHKTYVKLLDSINDKELDKLMINTVHFYCKALLNSDRVLHQSSDRQLLKHLGMFLGHLTFAKNKPILAKDIDLKALVVDAYKRGRLLPTLLFVKGCLEGCVDSKVFKPTNPMIAGILSLLAEVHRTRLLKMHNLFAIETAFMGFNMKVSDVTPSTMLKGLPPQNSQDYSLTEEQQPQKLVVPPPAPASAPATQPPPPAAAPAAAAPPASPLPAAATAAPTPPTPPPPQAPRLSEPAAARPAAAVTPEVPAAQQQQQQQQLQPSPPPAAPPAAAAAAAPSAAAAAAASPIAVPPPTLDQSLLANLHAYVVISPSLSMYDQRLQLRRIVPIAVDRAIGEIITPVVERSVTIACMTTYELIMKDFALDHDENRLRQAAQLMVSSMAGSLALVTCKEPLKGSLHGQLSQLLRSQESQNVVEHIVTAVVNDNLELACTLIEKTALERATRDIDKSLAQAYEQRRQARSRGQSFYDMASYQQSQSKFPAALPDSLKYKPGMVAQQRVYEDFARILRDLRAANARPLGPDGQVIGADKLEGMPAGGPVRMPQLLPNAELVEKYMLWQNMYDNAIAEEPHKAMMDGGKAAQLVSELLESVRTNSSPEEMGVFFAKRIFKHMYDVVGKQPLGAYVAPLEMLVSIGCKRIPAELSLAFVSWDEVRKFNIEVAEAMMRHKLLSLQEVDVHCAKVLQQTRSSQALDFALGLARMCKDGIISYTDMFNTLETALMITSRMPGVENAVQLIEQAKIAARMRPMQDKDKTPDPPGLREQVVALFEDWIRGAVVNEPGDRVHAAFMTQLRNSGLLKMDGMTDRFLRLLVEMAVSHCLGTEGMSSGGRADPSYTFIAVDALVKLVVCLVVAHNGGQTFLTRFLNILVGAVRANSEDRMLVFNARPYLRLFFGLLAELSPPDTSDAAVLPYLKSIGLALYTLQPSSVPGFAFGYLELVASNTFMPKLLMAPQQQGWALFEVLLVALLRFLEPHLRTANIPESIRALYKGALRVLLVLLHDFPEFLCEHHFQLCDVIPPTCIQMRNLILSAFPRNMRLPDPFTPNLKVDLLPEIMQPPRILPDPDKLLPEPIKSQVDQYLRTRQPANLVSELVKRLVNPLASEARPDVSGYNQSLINALVLYIGAQPKPGTGVALHTPAMELLQRLAAELDNEGRYIFLNAIANQLRYPNSHTHYFSCVLLSLFADAKAEVVQEQITRVLLERLIVNRPHPWGLLITFIELIKNSRYNFWSHQFTKCAPEIERLFESVARSCMGPSAVKAEEEFGAQKEAVRA